MKFWRLFPDIDPESARFWQLCMVLLLGYALYGGIQLMMVARQTQAEDLQQQLVVARARNGTLEQQIVELRRLNQALLPPSGDQQAGMDWETLRFLSFKRLDLIAPNQGIVYLDE
ncbi:MAG: hypothetical protein HRT36_01900 [Alphaproteobacteria bacterium]|nr:hypothetical protein [Alphaproteobacteria bacterium]